MGLITDADFNAESREIHLRLDIYFNENEVLTVTDNDYVMEANWLEESSADSTHPFGVVSANELSFKLYNEDGIFSPTNTDSPYFTLIKPGVKVVLYITSSDLEWEQLGEYYITNWSAPITGIYADVVAYDAMHSLFNSLPPLLPIMQNVTFKAFFEDIFSYMEVPVEVDSSLTTPLPFAFIKGAPREFLSSLLQGSLAFCMCDPYGVITIDSFIRNRALRATITDNDQIKTASVPQSLIKNYDGVKVVYGLPHLAPPDVVLDINSLVIPPGNTDLKSISYNKGPVWDIKYLVVDGDAELLSYNIYPWLLDFSVQNTLDVDTSVNIRAYGSFLSFTQAVLSDETSKLLEIDNSYIQSLSDATLHKNTLSSFINDDIPILTISSRGNPLLKVGDRLLVKSDKYRLDYDGIVTRLYYTYRGSLSCELTLITSAVMREV